MHLVIQLLLFVVVVVSSFSFEGLNVSRMCVGDYCFPRVIWSYWDNPPISEDIKEMIYISRKTLVNFTYCLIFSNNISSFLELEHFPKAYKDLPPVKKSDFLRLVLLEKYGGIYLDSSTYVFSEIGMEWFISESLMSGSQFTVFGSSPDFEVEHQFIGAPENSFYVKKYRKEFEVAMRMGFERYSKQTCKFMAKNNNSQPWVRCLPYFVIDLVDAYITFANSSLKHERLILPEAHGNNRFFAECSWSEKCFAKLILDDPRVKRHSFVKVPSGVRKELKKERKRRRRKEDTGLFRNGSKRENEEK